MLLLGFEQWYDHRGYIDDHRGYIDDHRSYIDDHRGYIDDHRGYIINTKNSGHLRLCQQPRAAHALRSDQ